MRTYPLVTENRALAVFGYEHYRIRGHICTVCLEIFCVDTFASQFIEQGRSVCVFADHPNARSAESLARKRNGSIRAASTRSKGYVLYLNFRAKGQTDT